MNSMQITQIAQIPTATSPVELGSTLSTRGYASLVEGRTGSLPVIGADVVPGAGMRDRRADACGPVAGTATGTTGLGHETTPSFPGFPAWRPPTG